MKTNNLLIAATLLVASTALSNPLVTSIIKTADMITLEWDRPTPSFIVEQSQSLVDWNDSALICATSTGTVSSSVQFHIDDMDAMFFKPHFGTAVDPFPDASLWEAVVGARMYTTGGTNQVYDIDFIGITNLTARNKPLSDCTGLEQLPDLAYVAFHNTQITNAASLTNAITVTHLYLFGNPILDVAPLGSMTNLVYLNLDLTSVTNILPLASLPHLSRLDIVYTPLDNFATLSAFTNLTSLEVAHDSITNADFLSSLISLTYLQLGGAYLTGLQDISGLSPLTALRELDLRYNNLSDLSPLARLTLMEDLNLVGNSNVSNISCVNNMPALANIKVSGSQVSDLTPLSSLTNLTYVYLPNNHITDLTPLISNASSGGLGSGDSVYISGNPLSPFAQTNQIPELTNTYGVTVYWP